MEKIVFRAIIVLSILGILIGAPMIYLGQNSAAFWSESYSNELKKDGAPEFKECLKNAIQQDSADEVKLCYTLYGSNSQLLKEWLEKSIHAQTITLVGFLISCVLPPLLFALFLIVRWILTGLWKRPGV